MSSEEGSPPQTPRCSLGAAPPRTPTHERVKDEKRWTGGVEDEPFLNAAAAVGNAKKQDLGSTFPPRSCSTSTMTSSTTSPTPTDPDRLQLSLVKKAEALDPRRQMQLLRTDVLYRRLYPGTDVEPLLYVYAYGNGPVGPPDSSTNGHEDCASAATRTTVLKFFEDSSCNAAAELWRDAEPEPQAGHINGCVRPAPATQPQGELRRSCDEIVLEVCRGSAVREDASLATILEQRLPVKLIPILPVLSTPLRTTGGHTWGAARFLFEKLFGADLGKQHEGLEALGVRPRPASPRSVEDEGSCLGDSSSTLHLVHLEAILRKHLAGKIVASCCSRTSEWARIANVDIDHEMTNAMANNDWCTRKGMLTCEDQYLLHPAMETFMLPWTGNSSFKFFRVLELGSGTGWLALNVANQLREFSRAVQRVPGCVPPRFCITATEQPGEAFAWLQHNVKRYPHLMLGEAHLWEDEEMHQVRHGQDHAEIPAVTLTAEPLDWAQCEGSGLDRDEVAYDLLLGSDLIYNADGAKLLPKLVAGKLRLSLSASTSRSSTIIACATLTSTSTSATTSTTPVFLYAHTLHRYDDLDQLFLQECARNGLEARDVTACDNYFADAGTDLLLEEEFEAEIFPEKRLVLLRIKLLNQYGRHQ